MELYDNNRADYCNNNAQDFFLVTRNAPRILLYLYVYVK